MSLPEQKVKVFIADDHDILIDSLSALFNFEEGIEFVGRANDAVQLLERLDQKKVDVLLLDRLISQQQTIELIREIRQSFPGLKIVLLSMMEDFSFAREAIENGATGYLSKGVNKQELISSIKDAFRGQLVIKVSGNNLEHDTCKKMKDLLSQREREIICLIAKGLRNKEIADQLQLSDNTIETHRRNVLKKLKDFDISNMASLMYKAAECKLCEGL